MNSRRGDELGQFAFQQAIYLRFCGVFYWIKK